jgi:hypothetical protein
LQEAERQGRRKRLAAEAQALNQVAVTGVVNPTKVIKETTPLPDEFEKTAARKVVLSVSFEMFR